MLPTILLRGTAMVLVVGIYGLSLSILGRQTRVADIPELLVTPPQVVQILFSAGDRYLAANLTGFRVLVADTARMKPADYAVQARLQRDIAWLNPAHEDNYYIAANILPWGGEVDAADEVLRRAVAARPWDFLPAFHVGFIEYHFRRSPAKGARWLLLAAERAAEPGDQWGLQSVAARWIERGYDTNTAAGLVDAMANSAPPGGFRRYLRMRAERLHSLARLREAARVYRSRHGVPPAKLTDLVADGLVSEIPRDPLGAGFLLDSAGEPELKPN
ncbi:MAG: hypothetical protein A3H93_18835 [Rhodocyclales bacterium RIFCSPLOWO2_02_FULL_63_24]|nr:MAG: hypothetical protein A3H93_18835 [Rhodocyclales bacterium RIFCSPLOWO2_02_FULL_63_24]